MDVLGEVVVGEAARELAEDLEDVLRTFPHLLNNREAPFP
jgi:hypothetical protein